MSRGGFGSTGGPLAAILLSSARLGVGNRPGLHRLLNVALLRYGHVVSKEDCVNATEWVRCLSLTGILIGAGVSLGIANPQAAAEQKERATSVLEQAVKKDPNNAELWVHLGFAYR